MPYLRYEAEEAELNGGAVIQRSLHFLQSDIAAEASDQRYVSLKARGASVSWRIKAAAGGFDCRFTLPDNNKGTGLSGSLGLYINGTWIRNIDLSSYWAYQYFITGDPDPYQTPKEKTFMRFDEVHFRLERPVKEGDILSLRKDNGDTLTYGVDFIELESLPAIITAPSGALSVVDFGAIPDDGKDDLPAFNACISAAASQHRTVYIPPGHFQLSDKLLLDVHDLRITGAGLWYTYLYFSTDKQFYGGIYARADNVDIAGFSLNTANSSRLKYGEQEARVPRSPYKMYKGFMGTYGNNSRIHDIWVEHFECGFWIAGYDPPLPVDITENLRISDCRIRNNYADGVNFCRGTSHSVVENCSLRNNGDDAMAVWPVGGDGVDRPCIDDSFRNNTVENNWRAGNIGIFGGYGHQIDHNILKDGIAGSGIRFTNDFPGYTFDSTHGQIRIFENTIIRCGTMYDIWNLRKGAIEIAAGTGICNLLFDNNDLFDPQVDAVQCTGKTRHLIFNNTRVDGRITNISASMHQ